MKNLLAISYTLSDSFALAKMTVEFSSLSSNLISLIDKFFVDTFVVPAAVGVTLDSDTLELSKCKFLNFCVLLNYYCCFSPFMTLIIFSKIIIKKLPY